MTLLSDVNELNPANPGNRTKAYRLRSKARKGDTVTPEEAAWLSDYEQAQAHGQSFGASASERVVHVEERSAAVGTGSAAEVAAAAALAREEGRRIDYLARSGMDALVKACDMYQRMAEAMLARTQALEEVHLAMLDSVRENYLARTQAEVDAIQNKEGEGGMQEALLGVLAQRLMPPAAPKK